MKKTLIALAVGHALVSLAHADDNTAISTTVSTDETGISTFQAVMPSETIIIEHPFSQQIGTQKITARDIKQRPTGNGNLSELMKTNPNVRYANRAESGNTAGEIAPDEVSIHGAKFYENNYTIDGLSNNDNINPGANNGQMSANAPDGYSPNDLPAGGTQSFWLDSSWSKTSKSLTATSLPSMVSLQAVLSMPTSKTLIVIAQAVGFGIALLVMTGQTFMSQKKAARVFMKQALSHHSLNLPNSNMA